MPNRNRVSRVLMLYLCAVVQVSSGLLCPTWSVKTVNITMWSFRLKTCWDSWVVWPAPLQSISHWPTSTTTRPDSPMVSECVYCERNLGLDLNPWWASQRQQWHRKTVLDDMSKKPWEIGINNHTFFHCTWCNWKHTESYDIIKTLTSSCLWP